MPYPSLNPEEMIGTYCGGFEEVKALFCSVRRKEKETEPRSKILRAIFFMVRENERLRHE